MAVSIKFYAEKRKDQNGNLKDRNVPILLSVTFNSQRLKTSFGLRAERLNQWSDANQKFRPSASNAAQKNQMLKNLAEQIEAIYYDAVNRGISPSVQYVKDHLKKNKKPQQKSFFTAFDDFVADQSLKNSWSTRTRHKFGVVKSKLQDFEKSQGNGYRIEFDGISENFFSGFLEYLLAQRYANTYIKKNLKLLRQFLSWCKAHGHAIEYDYTQFRFKGTEPKPGTNTRPLTMEQLMHLHKLDVKNDRLCKVRDCFVFQCFTGLRYSDLKHLKKSDVSVDGQFIKITTMKTGDPLVIPLVKYARDILERYKDTFGKNALPVISGQKYNDYLKELGKLAGLNDEITEVSFVSGKRIEKTYKHHERITSHVGRQTFVSNAIFLGLPTEIIRAVTGHSNDKIMRSYLKILDQQKVTEMAKFENFGKDK